MLFSGQPPQQRTAPPTAAEVEAVARDMEESEDGDTMKNLRKTFAGIFGDM